MQREHQICSSGLVRYGDACPFTQTEPVKVPPRTLMLITIQIQSYGMASAFSKEILRALQNIISVH
jgi:hypothetical protein